ncbi:aspartate aminotransferase [Ralstonia pickettii]|nr:aspartate aminotransferase [Ralstonia pickettii]
MDGAHIGGARTADLERSGVDGGRSGGCGVGHADHSRPHTPWHPGVPASPVLTRAMSIVEKGAALRALHTDPPLLTLSPGDEILIPDPGYSTFAMAPRLVGAVPVPYTLTVADAFVPDVDRLDSLVTERTRVLLVNSPSNPLGVVYPPEVVDALVAFARRHDLWIISDEVYEYLTFGVPFTSVLAAAPERTVGVFSLSKTYALTGARIGYLVTPPPLTPLFGPANEAIVSCVNAPAQYAALAAVTGPQDAVESARATYAANLAAARELLDARGIPYLRSDGAFYLWIDVSHASGGDVSSWAERFLVAERVAVAPGSAFGAAGEGWVRVCYAGRVEPLLTGLSRLPQP